MCALLAEGFLFSPQHLHFKASCVESYVKDPSLMGPRIAVLSETEQCSYLVEGCFVCS